MKLSVEAKVAASVAAGFVALTVGMIAQANTAHLNAGPNGYGSPNNAGISAHMSQRYDNSVAEGTDAEKNKRHAQ